MTIAQYGRDYRVVLQAGQHARRAVLVAVAQSANAVATD